MNDWSWPATSPIRAPRVAWGRIVAILLIVAVAARARTFGNPIIQVDEEFYLLMARAMVRGAVPYVDIWDRKPIGLFLVYLPAAPWSPQTGVYVYQAMALAAVVATAALIVRLARIAGWGRGGLVAAILYILWIGLADGQGGQSPVFYDLLMAGAVTLVAGAEPDRRRRAGVAAMALVGCALQIKYSVLFEGMWIGLWLMWDEHRITRSIGRAIGYGAVLCVVALVPTLIVAGTYLAIGQGWAFFYANFLSIFQRHPDTRAVQLDNLWVALELLGPLVVLTLAGIGVPRGDAHQRIARAFLRGWLVVAIAGFVVFGGWYNHYTLPVMLPGALCTAAFFGDRRVGRWLAIPAIVLAFVAGQLVLASAMHHRGSPAQFAAVVRAISPGPGSLYVDNGDAALYTFTGRHALSRYLFPTHLQYHREAGAIGADQGAELDRIFAQRPDVVVLQRGPDLGEDPPRVAQVAALVAQGGYAPPVSLRLGRLWADVYRLKRHRGPQPDVERPQRRRQIARGQREGIARGEAIAMDVGDIVDRQRRRDRAAAQATAQREVGIIALADVEQVARADHRPPGIAARSADTGDIAAAKRPFVTGVDLRRDRRGVGQPAMRRAGQIGERPGHAVLGIEERRGRAQTDDRDPVRGALYRGDPGVADIVGIGQPAPVHEIGLDVGPARIGYRRGQRQSGRAATQLAQADFTDADFVGAKIGDPPDPARDRQPAGAIARLETTVDCKVGCEFPRESRGRIDPPGRPAFHESGADGAEIGFAIGPCDRQPARPMSPRTTCVSATVPSRECRSGLRDVGDAVDRRQAYRPAPARAVRNRGCRNSVKPDDPRTAADQRPRQPYLLRQQPLGGIDDRRRFRRPIATGTAACRATRRWRRTFRWNDCPSTAVARTTARARSSTSLWIDMLTRATWLWNGCASGGSMRQRTGAGLGILGVRAVDPLEQPGRVDDPAAAGIVFHRQPAADGVDPVGAVDRRVRGSLI